MRYLNNRRRPGSIETGLAVIALAAIGVALAPTTPIVGIGIAGAVGLVWIGIAPVYAYVIGQLLFALLAFDAAGPPQVLGVQVALAVLLVGTLVRDRPLYVSTRAVAAASIAGGLFLGALAIKPVWGRVVTLLTLFGVLAYGLHRYERYRLGLVSLGGTDE